jgi:hypothetical protein
MQPSLSERTPFVRTSIKYRQTDIVLPVHGRNKPIALGQVGIRCQHCRKFSSVLNNIDPADKNRNSTQNAISYPSFISGIYNTVQQMYRLHFEQ